MLQIRRIRPLPQDVQLPFLAADGVLIVQQPGNELIRGGRLPIEGDARALDLPHQGRAGPGRGSLLARPVTLLFRHGTGLFVGVRHPAGLSQYHQQPDRGAGGAGGDVPAVRQFHLQLRRQVGGGLALLWTGWRRVGARPLLGDGDAQPLRAVLPHQELIEDRLHPGRRHPAAAGADRRDIHRQSDMPRGGRRTGGAAPLLGDMGLAGLANRISLALGHPVGQAQAMVAGACPVGRAQRHLGPPALGRTIDAGFGEAAAMPRRGELDAALLRHRVDGGGHHLAAPGAQRRRSGENRTCATAALHSGTPGRRGLPGAIGAPAAVARGDGHVEVGLILALAVARVHRPMSGMPGLLEPSGDALGHRAARGGVHLTRELGDDAPGDHPVLARGRIGAGVECRAHLGAPLPPFALQLVGAAAVALDTRVIVEPAGRAPRATIGMGDRGDARVEGPAASADATGGFRRARGDLAVAANLPVLFGARGHALLHP
ncbi:hypothetical protein TSA6c_08495 [Azospirillum sp. TSA6c]|nr:hypothetical protein TSA6c_08495 [Azospirillum sp. TSA6c]